MRPFHFLLAVTCSGHLAAQAGPPDHAAALAALVAPDTTPERRGELHAQLAFAPFARIGHELARQIARHPFESGIGWSTPTPWLEVGLGPGGQIAATLLVLWDHHATCPPEPGHVPVLLDIVEDPVVDWFRARLLPVLWAPLPSASTEHLPEAWRRLDRIARTDPSPSFRAAVVAALASRSTPNCLVDVAIDIARTSNNPREQMALLCATELWHHFDRLVPARRTEYLRFAFHLLRRLHDGTPATAWVRNPLVEHLVSVLDLGPAGGQPGAPEPGALPIFDWRQELACRLQGAATLSCRSDWHRHDNLALTTDGCLTFTAVGLAPFLPERPVAPGTKWSVPASRLTAFADVLGDVPWRTHEPDNATWRAWNGDGRYERSLTVDGALDVVCEQRAERTGLAITGSLVVSERARIGNRYGPNELQRTATHTIRAWLPLDAAGLATAFELQDEVDGTGRYGTERSGETFTQRATFATTGPFEPTTDEARLARELLDTLVDGSLSVARHRDAAAQFAVLGRGFAPLVLGACCSSTDYATRQRLGDLLDTWR